VPPIREPLDPKISLWHFLAFYMRFWREKHGLTLDQFGRIMGVARSSVCNMEACRQRPQDDQMQKLDEKFGTGLLFRLLLWFARMAHDPDWFRQFSEYEKQGRSLRYYHGQAVPLPLQTDQYTEALVQASTTRDPAGELAERLERKASVVEREMVPDIWVLLDEGALAREVGSREVMAAQLRHLLEMSEQPHVIVRVVPFSAGATVGADGSLQIISLDMREIAYSGAQGGGRLIESPGEVWEMQDMFNRIGAKAASEDTSRDIIRDYLKRYS
jgi:transcriptional regulator with XRE-family HTH domain